MPLMIEPRFRPVSRLRFRPVSKLRLGFSLAPRCAFSSSRCASFTSRGASLALCGVLFASAHAQQEKHGRGYKPLPPVAHVLVTVEKSATGKPLSNAAVIFRAVKNDETSANLEMKTDPDGHASIDLLEVGSHITVQVIAGGYATYASDFDLTPGGKQLLVKLQRPRAQVSAYGEGVDAPAEAHPGVQERPKAVGAGTPPKGTPSKETLPVPSTAATPGVGATPATPTIPASPSTPSTPGPQQ